MHSSMNETCTFQITVLWNNSLPLSILSIRKAYLFQIKKMNLKALKRVKLVDRFICYKKKMCERNLKCSEYQQISSELYEKVS